MPLIPSWVLPDAKCSLREANAQWFRIDLEEEVPGPLFGLVYTVKQGFFHPAFPEIPALVLHEFPSLSWVCEAFLPVTGREIEAEIWMQKAREKTWLARIDHFVKGNI